MTGYLSPSAISDILVLIEDGKDFLDYLQRFSARQGTVTHAKFRTERKELEAAEIANRIANALTTIDDIVRSKLPRYICGELNVVDGMLHRLVDRWGWGQVIGAGGDEFICRCKKEREEINRQYNRAVVSYVQLSKERPDISLLVQADPAMIVGTKPTMSLGEAEDTMADLKKALESPCVGKAWPTCTLAEVRSSSFPSGRSRNGFETEQLTPQKETTTPLWPIYRSFPSGRSRNGFETEQLTPQEETTTPLWPIYRSFPSGRSRNGFETEQLTPQEETTTPLWPIYRSFPSGRSRNGFETEQLTPQEETTTPLWPIYRPTARVRLERRQRPRKEKATRRVSPCQENSLSTSI